MHGGKSEVKFLGSFKDNFPKDQKKHVVFVGRSNVGKSSLINMLVGKKVAYVSKEPGRTRTINFFSFGKNLYLVDVPGYGYAKVSGEERERWKEMIEKYFSECKDRIALILLLIDGRVGPVALDEQMILFLEMYQNLPYVVVLTKWDKANQKQQAEVIKKVRSLTNAPIIPTSAKEGKGKEEILKYFRGIEYGP
ncbi:ribosome biogenesis GTP-binding protein YihA/YsxC [Thermocrinis sp.]